VRINAYTEMVTNMKNQTKQPWTDTRGRHLHPEKIKEMSKSWDLKTWEQYAESLEQGTQGLLMTSRLFNRVGNSQTENIFNLYSEKATESKLRKFIEKKLEILTTAQAHAVDLVFFQGLSLEQAAEVLGLGKTTVYDRIQRALIRLRTVMVENTNDLIHMRAEESQMTESLSREEEIYEVMQQEIRRNGSNYRDFDKE